MTVAPAAGGSPSVDQTRQLAAASSVLAMTVVMFVLFVGDQASGLVTVLFAGFVAAACVGVGVAMSPFVRRC